MTLAENFFSFLQFFLGSFFSCSVLIEFCIALVAFALLFGFLSLLFVKRKFRG